MSPKATGRKNYKKATRYSNPLAIYLTDKQMAYLDSVADASEVSKSTYVRDMIKRQMNEEA